MSAISCSCRSETALPKFARPPPQPHHRASPCRPFHPRVGPAPQHAPHAAALGVQGRARGTGRALGGCRRRHAGELSQPCCLLSPRLQPACPSLLVSPLGSGHSGQRQLRCAAQQGCQPGPALLSFLVLVAAAGRRPLLVKPGAGLALRLADPPRRERRVGGEPVPQQRRQASTRLACGPLSRPAAALPALAALPHPQLSRSPVHAARPSSVRPRRLALVRPRWEPSIHSQWPQRFRDAAAALLLASSRDGGSGGGASLPLSHDMLLEVLRAAAFPLSAWV